MTKNDLYKYVHTNQKNDHLFKLLISDEVFIKRAKDFKDKVGLHPKSSEEYYEWLENMSQKSREVFRSEDFQFRLKQIRDKKIHPIEKKKLLYDLHSEVPDNFLNRFSDQIVKDYKLPNHFHTAIAQHLISGRVDGWGIIPPFQFVDDFGRDGQKLDNQITIKIYQQLSEEDLKLLNNHIKHQSKNLPNPQEIKDLIRNLKIEQSYTNKEIGVGENDKPITNKDIAEEYLGSRKKNKMVYDIIDSLRQWRKRYFGSSDLTTGD